MKLKKGSLEAKKFMAKLRAKKGILGINSINLVKNKNYQWNGGAEILYITYIGKSILNKNIKIGSSMGKGFIFQWSDSKKYLELSGMAIKKYVTDIESDLSGWSKGNTRMIEMDEKPFKKLKNVRVKRTKDGVFNSFKVIPNMEQFIRDKRKKILGSVTSDNAKQLILDSIDTSDYDVNINTIEDKIRFVEKTFLSEYGYSVTKLGKQKALQEWLMGLPSVLTLPFYNVDILNLAKQWGALKNNATERAEDKILSNYWKLMASQLLQLFNKRKLNKKFY